LAEITYREAIREGIREEMLRDDRVFLIGEDIGAFGGSFQVTKGLYEEFGPDRVVDTPISELAITGASVGAAVMGMRPILEIMYQDFLSTACDQILNNAAKMRYMTNGNCGVPMVLRTQYGAGTRAGLYHSQSLEAMYAPIPGLKIVMPSTPADAKGLLKAAVRDPDPVLIFEHKLLYGVRGEVPDGSEQLVPIGKAATARPGSDLTIVAVGMMVRKALSAANTLAEQGIEAEVLDLRSVRPMDTEAIVESVSRTGRLVIVHEAPVSFGIGAEIAAVVAKEAFGYLDAPIERVGAPDTPVPFSASMEDFYLPNEQKIVEAALRTTATA